MRPPRPCLAPSPLQRAPTLCLPSGRGGRLALFYDFNDPLSTPGEIPNLGTAGPDYNALVGKTDGALAAAVALDAALGNEVPTLAPAFVAADAIPNKQEEPAAPLVVYALPGTTVDLAAHGLPAGGTYDAPADLNATVVLERAGTEVHVLPLRAPEVLDERHRLISAVEDSPVAIYVLPGPQHTWNRGMRPVVTRLPTHGKLYVQEGTVTVPVTEGQPIDDGVDHAYSVQYVPDAQVRLEQTLSNGSLTLILTLTLTLTLILTPTLTLTLTPTATLTLARGPLAMATPWPLCAHDWRICKRG